jgi:hypothetical protein
MNAIQLLKDQHREVERLFARFEESEHAVKRRVFEKIADDLAVHASIEERFFYPAVRARQTEERLEEAFDEHLDIKKLLLEAMHHPDAPGFDGKVSALKGAVEHHVEEEESQLFKEVERIMNPEALGALGQMMEGEAAALIERGSPRNEVRAEAEPPEIHP